MLSVSTATTSTIEKILFLNLVVPNGTFLMFLKIFIAFFWVQFPKGSPNPIRYRVAGLKSGATGPVVIVNDTQTQYENQ